ncbi:phage tail protein [Pseudoalteromonas piscicida]|uniref:phage tail-collar fiber domain-containing protein n=1 Tax=Pseudoalteromonas piscicida TaxID=43662 RepID=UPI002738AA95|nr:phage tail protein [Pseudoalteromonas piscicida]MDP4487261.1 phage tail protein [Pseudoalteromonas piscicida]
MSQLKITSAGIAYKNDVFAGTETLNMTKMVFAHVPGLNADSPILSDSVPANIVHNQPIDRVSSLDGDAVVISSVLGYDVGNFTFNWFGAIAKKANGTEVLIAIVHTNEQTKTRTDGANTGDYSVKSIIWRSQQLAGELNVTLPTLPWQVNDGVFATKSDIESLEQYIKNAGLGTQISHQSENFFDRTFEFWLGAGESKPFPDLPDSACDILIFGLTDGTVLSTNFVGRFTKYGSTWSANAIYGDANIYNHPSIDVVDNMPIFENKHGANSYKFSFKCWIACQDRGNAKPFEFFANTYSTYNKPKPADISEKLDRFEQSFVDTNGVQDLKIRGKRALVGTPSNLEINYGTDWSSVYAYGDWNFNGDITITKNNPWLTLKSNTEGSVTNEQAAGISIGESGRTNAASLHLTYIGNGSAWIGMGDLGDDSIPDNWAMQMNHQQTWVRFRSEIHIGDDKTKLSKGNNHSLKVVTPYGFMEVGAQTSNHCHMKTSLPSFLLNKSLRVEGEIYAGSNYDKRVYHEGYKPSASDIGAFQRHFGITPEVNNSEFTTIAKVIGSGLASRCSITLKGTTASTVINFSADILVNHSKDIVVESLSGDYTKLELKILSNEDERYLIQVKLIGGNSLSLACHILSHTNDNVSIGNYSSINFPVEHIHKSKRSSRVLSSTNETNMFVEEHKLFHTGNTNVRDWNIVTSHSNSVRWYKVASFYANNTNDSYRWFINIAGTRGYSAGFNDQSGGATIYVTKANDWTANNLNVVAYNHCISNTLSSLIRELKVTSEDVSGQNTWFTIWARFDAYTGASALMSGTDCSSNFIKLHTNESQEAEPEGGFKKPIFTSIHSGNVDEYLVGERKKPLVSGVIPAHSNVHLKTSETFTLPPVAETPEDTVIVVSKRLSETPTLQSVDSHITYIENGTEKHINTLKLDVQRVYTLILNDEQNWELQ